MTENNEKTQLADLGSTQMVPGQGAEPTQMAVTIVCPVCKTENPGGDRYCADCGFLLSSTPVEVTAQVGPMAKLVDVSTGRESPLNPGINTIGRQDADVLLTHPTVSRRHAQITVAGGEYLLEDLGSTNGTFVGDERVEPGHPVEVGNGAEVKFGSAVVRLEAPPEDMAIAAAEAAIEIKEAEEREEEAEESAMVEEAAEEPPPPPVDLEEAEHEATDESEVTEIAIEPGVEAEFEASPDQALAEPVQTLEIHEEAPTLARLVPLAGEEEYLIRPGENSLGRRPANDIVIPDPYVSGNHAVITASDGCFSILDLGSTNGTFVNGEKLVPNEPRQLTDGDRMTVGQIEFRFTI
ncbi:MAG: FHA domain-containing protein [Armatimonadetes bacterium]|nr:FHA domain-containing protein [Armatimonadota bacterium]